MWINSIVNSIALRFDFRANGQYTILAALPSDWTHVVINYIGPENGQGIRIYYDGEQADSDTTRTADSKLPGDGRIVIGRYHTDWDDRYASVQLDELIFFNMKLSESEITVLSQFWLCVHYNAVICFVNTEKNHKSCKNTEWSFHQQDLLQFTLIWYTQNI